MFAADDFDFIHERLQHIAATETVDVEISRRGGSVVACRPISDRAKAAFSKTGYVAIDDKYLFGADTTKESFIPSHPEFADLIFVEV